MGLGYISNDPGSISNDPRLSMQHPQIGVRRGRKDALRPPASTVKNTGVHMGAGCILSGKFSFLRFLFPSFSPRSFFIFIIIKKKIIYTSVHPAQGPVLLETWVVAYLSFIFNQYIYYVTPNHMHPLPEQVMQIVSHSMHPVAYSMHPEPLRGVIVCTLSSSGT